MALQRIVGHQEDIIKTMRDRHDREQHEWSQWAERVEKLSESNEQLAALQALKKLQLQVRDLGIQDVDESWEAEEEEEEKGDMVLLQAIDDLREEFVGIQSMHVQRGQELQKHLDQLRCHISLQDQVNHPFPSALSASLWPALHTLFNLETLSKPRSERVCCR